DPDLVRLAEAIAPLVPDPKAVHGDIVVHGESPASHGIRRGDLVSAGEGQGHDVGMNLSPTTATQQPGNAPSQSEKETLHRTPPSLTSWGNSRVKLQPPNERSSVAGRAFGRVTPRQGLQGAAGPRQPLVQPCRWPRPVRRRSPS